METSAVDFQQKNRLLDLGKIDQLTDFYKIDRLTHFGKIDGFKKKVENRYSLENRLFLVDVHRVSWKFSFPS